MATLKGTPSNITENSRSYEYNGKTYYEHLITINGEVGKYSSVSPKCTKFQVGIEAEYEREVKVNGNHTNIKFKPIQASGGGGQGKLGGGGGYQKDMIWEIADKKLIVSQNAMIRAVEIAAMQGKKELPEIFDLHGKIFDQILSVSATVQEKPTGFNKTAKYYQDKIAGAAKQTEDAAKKAEEAKKKELEEQARKLAEKEDAAPSTDDEHSDLPF